MLIIDANIGLNVNLTKIFNEAIGITGFTMTKLDGQLRVIIFALAQKIKIPIRYTERSEDINDLEILNLFIGTLFAK
ncbi:MAG: hypothetical protein V6007_00565 [Candidatus Dasytiphilus stammeri]